MSKKVIKNYNSLFIQLLGEKPIAFNPSLARIAKSASAGLFLSQLLYWHDKGSTKGWIYKTIDEMRSETLLTRSEQDRAIKIWKELGVLEVTLRSIPRRRFFRVDIKNLVKILREEPGGTRLSVSSIQSAGFSKQDCTN